MALYFLDEFDQPILPQQYHTGNAVIYVSVSAYVCVCVCVCVWCVCVCLVCVCVSIEVLRSFPRWAVESVCVLIVRSPLNKVHCHGVRMRCVVGCVCVQGHTTAIAPHTVYNNRSHDYSDEPS